MSEVRRSRCRAAAYPVKRGLGVSRGGVRLVGSVLAVEVLHEWPRAEREPIKYVLRTLSADTSLTELVAKTMMRWRIERDYQELKQEFGLSHYEGRGWRGFHHHATLCVAAYGILIGQRLKAGGNKKTPIHQKRLAYPKITGRAAARMAQRHLPDSIATLRSVLSRAIAQQLDRCPCCGHRPTKRNL